MSLLSSVILPALEKNLESQLPGLSSLVLSNLGNIGSEIVAYLEQKEAKIVAAPVVAPAPVQAVAEQPSA